MDMRKIKQILFLFLVIPFLWGNNPVQAADMDTAMQECLMEEIQKAGDDVTIGELKARCKDKEETVAEKTEEEDRGIVTTRIYTDDENVLRPWTIMAHRPNYILLASYNDDPNNEPWRDVTGDLNFELDNVESQFQISAKFPLAVDLFSEKMDIFAAYTVRSFWQLYNSEESAPFREVNHEPEAWLQFRNNWSIFGFENTVNMIGFVHQSNGRNEPLSRSWNRIFANLIFQRNNLAIAFKPWIRIEEDDDDDDNPDITDYLGHFQTQFAYKWKDHTFGLMLRNNLESGFSEGAVEATWSFPLGKYKFLKGYIQGFSGYGQNLLDYNKYQRSIGLGFAVTDWL